MAARNIRTWDDVKKARKAGAISEAEEKLIDCCQTGLGCDLGKDVPMAPSKARNIGADLLRYLVTGGCDKAGLHEMGVQLQGAYISDPLRLDMCRAVGKTSLDSCYFAERLDAESTEFQLLDLEDSHFPNGIRAQAVKVASSVFLRGITAKATVNLNSAEIGGQLACEGAQLLCEDADALNAQGAKIKADVFLTEIKAKATVNLASAEIGGHLDFEGASLCAKKGAALFLQSARASAIFWRGVVVCDGRVDLTSAQVGDLVDDTTSWAKVSAVDLDRFSYQHLQNPWTVEERLEWLAKDQETAGAFQPQPYQQLAKVYGEMGHDADRRRVLLEKEKLTTAAENARIQDALAETTADIIEAKRLAKLPTLQSSDHEILENERRYLRQLKNRTLQLRKARNLNTLWRGFLSLTIGYGYSPLRVLAWAAGLIVAVCILSNLAMETGGMAPNSDVVLTSEAWTALVEAKPKEDPSAPTVDWLKTEAGRHYETFNALAYAADVVIPLVPLEQEAAWAPTTQTWLGWSLWVFNWVAKLFGWILTGLGAAAITGHIRRD